MNFIRGIYNFKKQHRGCVLTIGNFDGVHCGHQSLVKLLVDKGHQDNLPVVVMLFEPHPLEIFLGNKAPARLTCLREKLHYLEQMNVDAVLCIRFNRQFARYSAQKFIVELLVNKLDVRFLAVGKDFRFGIDRQGDFLLLQDAGVRYGFEIMCTRTIYDDHGKRISSTSVREALSTNNFALAQKLLGHPFSISGRVVHGNALGRTIGFPTANILLRRIVMPVRGVFIVEVKGLGEQLVYGVANIGLRPTVKGINQQLEVHLFNTHMDFYGCYIEVILKKKIREEQKFDSLGALKMQIVKDVAIAHKFFLKTYLKRN
ncbi:bifunctional riboflavin kinase/FAD synthetase [Pantoea sp. Mhis]|uniref:bifunctional riboflavin kinase/FAD synthetase n=1 Tax=Pantoea sp. Mhis TaxID=2576759 RepID=UPI0013587F38|nr:bifunctional riboflavin kinase/FAD synthetase [Pantoea sp. Mhis]MXP56469.1 bifunctional riboflavin kinase/FAD synthetase [Pantoea sp. Mhis]